MKESKIHKSQKQEGSLKKLMKAVSELERRETATGFQPCGSSPAEFKFL